jgi:L-alanine-DL-glutamate epimerase-like enolase superfamily enzyme
MHITGVTQCHAEYEMDGTFHPTWIPGFAQGSHEAELFKLETDAGLTGITAGPSLGGLQYQEQLEGFLVGEDPRDVQTILGKLDSFRLSGPRPWHIELALWDIIGKDAGKPVHELFGATAEPIPVYASTGATMDAEQRIEYIDDYVTDTGIEAVKLRVTDTAQIEVVREIRAAFPELTLMVDANKGWSIRAVEPEVEWSYKDALGFARELEELENIGWLEEPLPRHQYDRYAALRAATDIPIAGGEFNDGIGELTEFIRLDALDVMQADAALATGMKRAVDLAAMADATGMEFVPHTWTNGAGFAANLHVMAVAGSGWCEYPLEPPWDPEVVSFFLDQPFTHEDGSIEPPTDPGLGITIDWDTVTDS